MRAVPAVLLAALLLAPAAAKAQLSAQEIADRSEQAAYYQADDGRARVQMEIIDPQRRSRARTMTILRHDMMDGGEQTGHQRFYVYFHEPADIRDTVFMVHKHPDANDDRWLYLPALDLVRRIAAEDERSSFVGSDYFYEDVSGRGSNEDAHTLQETTEQYYVLRSVPKRPELVEFDHYVSYIHKQTFIPVQVQYFKADGTKYRQYTVNKVETIEGYPTVAQSTMEALQEGGKSTLTYTQVDYDVGLSADIFTERYLRNPPRGQLTSTE
ncbi:outer membrane lipoprotein-sorting protein [Rhodovibrio salinarum]|uniref:Outer membrane lipoprotein-sorting protein n=1 Tax=Rhodovibrio salinarum TaxID=1087 RepID=A0A934QFQ2_9PROT|nr:outer membrane lipoprotein-sorting protein [Rhodovibrio salinarum]MBK1695792.1 outer membrane lipoprotein-sorting protein [Rhodovibrio salinarum]